MPKQGKTPKKKSKEKTPQKSGESEYPAMDQEELNRLVQNAIEQSQAQLQQKHEEQIKVVEERLTKKFDDEVREVNRAFEESRGANPTTRDTTWMRDVMTEAVVAANNANLHTQKPYIPNLNRFLDALEEQKYSPYIASRGSRERNLLALPTLDMYLPLSKLSLYIECPSTLLCNPVYSTTKG